VSSERVVERLELQRRLTDALESLEEPARSLLRDHYLGEQTLASIARRDGVAESTLRSRRAAGLAALRARLDSGGLGDDGENAPHWSIVLTPLASVPRLIPTVPLSTSAVGTTSTLGLGFANALSFLGILIMKHAVLSVAAIFAVIAIAWQVLEAPGMAEVQTDPTPGVQSANVEPLEEPILATPAPELSMAEVHEIPAARVDLAGTFGTKEAAGSAETLMVSGTIAVEGTVIPPPPCDVSIWLHSNYLQANATVSKHSVRSEAGGTFQIELPLPDEVVTITARAAVDGCVPHGGLEATVPAGETSVELALVYLRRDTTVHGVVVTPDGQPAAGARVSWNKYEAVCAADGTYELLVAPRYVYRIYASHTGFGRTAAVADGMEPGSSNRIDFTLTEGFDIHGIVRDEQGAAIGDAQVGSLFRDDRVSTDADGRFSIEGVSRTDRDNVEVHVSHGGYVIWSKSLPVPAEGDLVIEPILKRGAQIAGRVTGPAGKPVEGASIVLAPGRNFLGALRAQSDGEGRFSIANVEPGERLIWVEADGHADLRYEITVAGATEAQREVVLELQAGRTVQGRVLNGAGVPVEGISVAMRLNAPSRRRFEYVGNRGVSDANGEFELRHLPCDELVAETYAEHWVRATAQVADNGTVTLVVQRAGAVRGRVLDGATGAPIESFRIRTIDPLLGEGDVRASGYEAGWAREGFPFEDLNGAWALHRIEAAAGTVLGVQASAPGFAPAVNNHVVVQPVASGEEVVLELWHATDLVADVSIEASGIPVAGVRVLLSQEKRPGEMDPTWIGVANDEGVALVSGVAPGPIWAQVLPMGTSPSAPHDRDNWPTLGPFTVEPGTSGEAQRLELVISQEHAAATERHN
jgi:hypothetical protein